MGDPFIGQVAKDAEFFFEVPIDVVGKDVNLMISLTSYAGDGDLYASDTMAYPSSNSYVWSSTDRNSNHPGTHPRCLVFSV